MSVGKTTLVKALKENEKFKNYTTFIERSQYLNSLGIPLNKNSTIEGQLIFGAERAAELLVEDMITDRTIWDVCSFTSLTPLIELWQQKLMVSSLMLLKDKYDIVFYISPEGIDVEDNGVRTTDVVFRNQLDKKIQQLLHIYKPMNMYTYTGGTVEDRVKFILDKVKEYENKTFKGNN
jgi:GTPase SAR1 family protein